MKYQFLYCYGIDKAHDMDKDCIITANSIKAACGKFTRNRKNQLGLCVDYEVMVVETRECIDISEIKSIKEFVR